MVEVVPLAGALAHAGEHRVAAVLGGDVPNELLDDDCLAHAGAAERAHLAAPQDRRDQVDDLDACLEQPWLRLLVLQGGGRAVDGIAFFRLHWPFLVDGLAEHVEDAAQGVLAHRHGDGLTSVNGIAAAPDAIRR